MAVARNNRHNAAFVVGSVFGAVAGAAVALWKTPYTGEELRSKLTGTGAQERGEVRTYAPTTTGVTAGGERSIKDKVLAGVEKTLAPIVGVELGKTANRGDTTATPMDSGDIKVSPEYGSTRLRHSHAWKDGTETSVTAGTGSERIGLSVDKVDPEKWAAAYGTSVDTTATTQPAPAPVRSEPARTEDVSDGYGSTLLRHPHAWKDGTESAPASGTGNEKIGLSVDRVDAEKWASAYGTDVPSGSTETRDSGYASKAAESEAQTGLGAKPAFPGSDQTGHEPVDPTAPDSSVADVDRRDRDPDIRTDSGLTMEDAAPVEVLTTPQIDRVPDSQQLESQGGYHPFPDLGGKEGSSR